MGKKILLNVTAFIALVLCYMKANAQLTAIAKADSSYAQRAENIYLEVGGTGIFLSLKYDTRLTNRRNGLGVSVGYGYIPFVNSIPVQLNYLLGKTSHFLEIGAGGTYLSISRSNSLISFSKSSELLGTATFGYRYQPIRGGFNFRVNVDPIFDSQDFLFFGGLSFGYTFK